MYDLRPYQHDCIAGINRELSTVDSTLAVMATGLGKTVAFSTVARDWQGGGVMVVAHRDELISQAASKIEAITGHEPWTEKAERTVNDQSLLSDSKVVVTSVQTLGQSSDKRRARVFNWAGQRFGGIRLIVVDEAHRFTPGSQYHRLVNDWRERSHLPVKLLGVTATPRRTDDTSLGSVFDSCAYQYGIADAIRDGWLVPITQQSVRVNGLDFSNLKVRRNRDGELDFNETELQRILVEEKALQEVAAATKEHAGNRQGLVFCSGVEHARAMCAVMQRYFGEAEVAYVHGGTDRKERRDILDRYSAGQLRFVCNCGVLTEGFDAPSTSLIVMARPTKSLLLFTQIIGRGTRPLPGLVDGVEPDTARRAAIAASSKPDCMVLDFVGNAGRHKLATCVDVLGGTMSDEQRAAALEYAQGTDVLGAVATSAMDGMLDAERKSFTKHNQAEERQLSEEANAWRYRYKRRDIKADAVTYESRAVDIFDRHATADYVPPPAKHVQAPWPWQIKFLCERGWTPERAGNLSQGAAYGIIGKLKKLESKFNEN